MKPLLRRDAVRALDRDAIERLKVPGVVLMENAGLGAAQLLMREFSGAALERVLIVGGVGQNGGDAWVVARQLALRGIRPRCVLVGDPAKVQGDAAVNLQALRALGLEPEICQGSLDALRVQLAQASLVVDGLFGTGLDRDITGFYADAITAINDAGRPVFALDLPSGVDADTGQVRGVAVRASFTATFAAHKPGLHQFPGAALAGRSECVAIGVPLAPDQPWGIIEPEDVARAVTPRPLDAHKGTNGRVLILAGSRGKTGAALLSAISALRAGAGLVTIASDAETQRVLEHKVLEVMTEALSDDDALADALRLAEARDVALLGPGFGLTPDKRTLAIELARQLPVPCVLDADALTALGTDVDLLQYAKGPRVLTPHPGEAARLLGCTVPAVEADRCGSAQRLAEASGQVVVLKGARTVIASPSGLLRVCTAGTPALGTAGTGDVLAGLIATLTVSLRPFQAAWAGVELHARAGTLAVQGDRGLVASDVTRFLAAALEQCRGRD
ncbi:MAG: NAD(P)H-hydrate dehydratase [Myxococcales bacterium]